MINKEDILHEVAQKCETKLNKSQIYDILNILIDELSKDLFDLKLIKIKNFCEIFIERSKKTKYWNTFFKMELPSKPNNFIRFNLTEKLKKIMNDNIDKDSF